MLALLLACKHAPPPDPAEALGVLPCTTLAAGDSCLLEACNECIDFCGLECASVDGTPLSFTCPGVGSFTAEEFCPAPPPEPEPEPATETADPAQGDTAAPPPAEDVADPPEGG